MSETKVDIEKFLSKRTLQDMQLKLHQIIEEQAFYILYYPNTHART